MKVILILQSSLVFLVTFVTGQCPNSAWIRRGNNFYFLKMEKGDFYENIALCNQLNASLVTIVNEKENDEVSEIADNFWLGLGRKENSSKSFYWHDGTPFVFNNWDIEPNTNGKYWAAYSMEGQWDGGSAFSRRNQMCLMKLKPSNSYKKTSNPVDLQETVVTGQCPNSTWVRRANKCYFVKKEYADLYENIALCNQLNASMVSIANEEENIHVTQLISSFKRYGSTFMHSGRTIWLGLGQRWNYSHEFYWFDGSPFVFESWRKFVRFNGYELKYHYFGAYLAKGEWYESSALSPNLQVCSLDLKTNASPNLTPIPAEFRETESETECANQTWKRIGNKCIYFDLTKRVTYMQNQALCKELNATMVSIHSDAESFQLNRLYYYSEFWIGLRKTYGIYGPFEWEDGSPFTYKSWLIFNHFALSSDHWAAYSLYGNWHASEKSSHYYPCCQISLLTNAVEAYSKPSANTATLLPINETTVDAISKNTKSPSAIVTKKITESNWTTATFS